LKQSITTHIVPFGDEWAIIIPDETLKAVGWTLETEIDVHVENGGIVLMPIHLPASK